MDIRNSEGYLDLTPYEACKNQKDLRRQIIGARSNAVGRMFENIILKSCEQYRVNGIAVIDKTPEPMRVTRDLGSGKFEAYFAKKAQADLQGTIRGGRSICFESKCTDRDRISQDRVTDEQTKFLEWHHLNGALTFVLVSFNLQTYYRVPWAKWSNMKAEFGHKYVKQEDLKPYRVPFKDRLIMFLNGIV